MLSKSAKSSKDTIYEAFRPSMLSGTAFGLLLIFVLAAPIPWGSVQPGLTGTGKITAGAFVIAFLVFIDPGSRLPSRRALLPAAGVAGIGALGFFQAAPLPGSVLKVLSPVSFQAWDGARGILASFAATAGAGRISLAPRETVAVSLLAFAFAALFVASASLLRLRSRRRILAAAVVASGLAQVALALAGGDRLSRLGGSFVNPNNLAGYLLIPLAFAFALVWYRTRRQVAEFLKTSSTEVKYMRLESLIPLLSLSILLWGSLATGVGLSQSRGGIVAATGGTLVMLSLAALHRQRRSKPWQPAVAASLVFAVTVGTVLAITNLGKLPFLRFLPGSADLAEDYRVLIWRHSVEAFRSFPWLGSGLGTFREAFRRVQPEQIRGLVDQAHDEYLQILVTGGIVGTLLAVAAIAIGAWLLFRSFFAQPHREESAYVLAGIGSLAGLLLHGAAEFNFSIPAIPATLAVVLGGAWAAAGWTRSVEPALPDRAVSSSSGRRRRRSAPPAA
jgi:O-antigen ligase